ncbi:CheR family methyltransferase [Sphingosinicella terrae]|uniref:CheR family methyltransferase n=1 Tax=Sphingosinicella terrae TaxID=2172047 RepID=UPI000E0D8DF0|nr:CheR family methyltransferase [Sphingosinicella terrae]
MPHRPAASVPVHDPDYQAIKAQVIDRTGHFYYAEKDDPLWERIAARMKARGCPDPAGYRRLLGDGAVGEDEWRRLESAVTINETFFFRFAEQFDVLRRILLPGLIARARESRRLRIWSVGCSTGAEPYSIAILLDDLLAGALADWRISITGTDIDEAALETARAARYNAWALRTLGDEERVRLFDREGDLYRLKTRYRGLVRFERHNMMDLLDPAAPLQFSDYDLILCRNVLIYFRQDVAKRLIEALTARLDEQGHLLVGHAEPSPDFAEVASQVEIGGVRAYRRLGLTPSPPPAPVPPLPLPRHPPTRPVRRSAPAARSSGRTTPSAPAHPIPADLPSLSSLADVRLALAGGDGDTALRLAEREAGLAPRDPVPHYLAALGALALGHSEQAERGFRKALYLDNRFAMAHYLLGRHLMAEGRSEEGRRSLANALRAVAGSDPESELPEGDGMTAEGLALAVRNALR